jgi:hypothetical protein
VSGRKGRTLRIHSIVIAAAVLLTCAPAGAHTVHKADPVNKPRIPIDVKRVGVGHKPERILVSVAAHRAWRKQVLVARLNDVSRKPVRGKTALTVTWRVASGKIRMALATFSKGKLLLRIYRGEGKRWIYLGTGKAQKFGKRAILLGIPASQAGKLPKKTFQYWVESGHLPKPTGFRIVDRAPSVDAYRHRIPRL